MPDEYMSPEEVVRKKLGYGQQSKRYDGNDSICSKCAQKAGYVPRDGACGHWVDKCSVCGVEQTVCAKRDYR